MSATARPAAGGTRIIQLAALLVCFGVLYGARHLRLDGQADVSTISALGFFLTAGTLFGELLEPLGVPHLTAYLAVGVLAGPYVLGLVDRHTVDALRPVDTLALALIAFAGGAELKLDLVRQGFRSLLVATGVQSVLGIVGTALVFAAASPLMPFMHDRPVAFVAGVALLWGVMSITRSPAATLGILSQTRARGPLTRFSLAFVMTSDVVVIVVAAAVMTFVRPLLEPGASLSTAEFEILWHEVLGSVSIGTTLGLVIVAYLRFVRRQFLVVLLALGFGFTEVINYLRFEPLLTFLVAGFLVQNLSRQGERFLGAIEDMGSVVYVSFFAIAGAQLDLPLLRPLWAVALILFVARFAVTVGLNALGARLARDPPVLSRWGWSALVSQAGVALGIAANIDRENPSFGASFRSLVIATVALNQLVGPVVFKVALDRSKETSSLPEKCREPLAG